MSEREAAIQIGEALATLRRERGLSQAEAGARIGMTSQGWSLYEAGRRAGIFRPDVQKRLTQALEATPDDLSLLNARDAVAEPTHDDVRGVSSKGRDFDGMPPAPKTVRFRMGSNDMAPWAFADTIIEYDPNRVPRSGAGCVVELMDGRKLVGLFAQQTATQVAVHDAAGQGVTLSLANVRRVAAVIARHDA
jgi:transcriptional regulator with XRE-family HTH domain